MKPTGIVRKIDSLGRVVIPIELRRTFDLSEGDLLEIFVGHDGIVFRKMSAHCALCGSYDDLEPFRDKYVCRSCRDALARSASAAKSNESA